MPPRCVPFVLVSLLGAVLAGGCGQRDKGAGPAPLEGGQAANAARPTSGAPAQSETPYSAPSFAEHLPADSDNLLVITDPLPHLRAVLSAPAVRQVLVQGRLGRLAGQGPGRSAPDPSMLVAQLNANSRWVPDEIALALPAGELAEVAAWCRAGLYLGLASGAASAGDEAVESDLPKIQAELLATLERLGVPQATIWIRFRQPGSASQFMQQLRGALQQFQGNLPPNVRLTLEASRLGMEARVGDLVPQSTIEFMLAALNAVAGPEDPRAKDIAAAVAALQLSVWADQIDRGIRFRIGPRLEDDVRTIETAQLGPLWKPDRSLIAFGTWDVAELRREMAAVEDTWKQWEETPTGRETAGSDEDDLLGSLRYLNRELARSSSSGSMRVSGGSTLTAELRAEGLPPAADLAELPILSFVPPEAGLITLNSTQSIGDQLASQLASFEDRLARNSLKYELSGREDQAALADRMSEHYYGRMDEFRRLILDRALEVFEPPAALLLDTAGRVELVDVEFEAPPGQTNRMTARGMPAVEFAAIGRLAGPADEFRFANDVWRAFLTSFSDEVPETVVAPLDLGLDVPTVGFSDVWTTLVPANLSVKVEGDLLPHYFIVDGWFVFSTSRNLSQRILAAHGGTAGEPFRLPADGSPVTAWGRMPGTDVAAVFELLGHWFAAFTTGRSQGSITVEGPVFAGVRGQPGSDWVAHVIYGIAEFCRLLEQAEWRTVDEGQVRTTRFEMTFADSVDLQP